MTETLRKPAVFSVDDPRLTLTRPEEPLADEIAPEAPDGNLPAVPVPPARKGFPWGGLFWSALSGLVVMGLGLAVTSLIEDLFARNPWLGAAGLALGVLAGLALLVIVLREIVGLFRLGKVEALRRRALETIESDNRDAGRALLDDMLALTQKIPRLARGRSRLEAHRNDIIDGRDLVLLAERELMAPLDLEARTLIAAAAKRVSVVTAISPRAAVDMLFVLVNALNLIRRLAALYGGRPGALGVLKLFRQVMSHLAVTGGVAVTDSLLQQLIGHGLAARVSARLGEGMVNGLLTARLGLLAIDLVRPLPFHEIARPSLNDVAGALIRGSETGSQAPETVPRRPPQTP